MGLRRLSTPGRPGLRFEGRTRRKSHNVVKSNNSSWKHERAAAEDGTETCNFRSQVVQSEDRYEVGESHHFRNQVVQSEVLLTILCSDALLG